MPKYQARRHQPRRYNRKKVQPWYQKRYNAMELAQKALSGVKYIRGLVNSEMLHKRTDFSTTVSGSGSVNSLVAIGQDDTISGRTGNSILVRNLSYRCKLEINAAVTSNTTFTMMIIQDSQQVGDNAPAVTDILVTANTYSLLNDSQSGRFQILSRKNITLTPASGGRPAVEWKGYHKLYTHIRYNGTTSTDIQKNGIYLLILSSEGTNYPTFSGSFKLGYHDN